MRVAAAAISLGITATACGGGSVASAITASVALPAPLVVGAGAPTESSSAIQHTIGDGRFTTTTAQGTGTIPYFSSLPLASAHPGITRVVVIVHGEQRDAGEYFNDVTTAQAIAGADATALVIAPQFLNTMDVDDPRNNLPATILGWRVDEYSDGKDAQTPSPLSAFDVLDALVGSFTNRGIYPDLHTIVLAGHSGGAQLITRYAIVGTGFAAAATAGYDVRFVVVSPSSYLYFDSLRPAGAGFAPADANACPAFNSWRYGFTGAPRYVGTPNAAALFAQYATENVTFISGSLDTDRDGSIDQSCGAEDEGIDRVTRANNYFAYLTFHNGGTPIQAAVTVTGIGHSDSQMLVSPPAVAALFGP
ncbi:MAG TPA: hypothetical protein VGP41_10930 [Candidatus Lustribacter sp.]|nr:hypothetical protein [Candidatus Lustribacter sp.]